MNDPEATTTVTATRGRLPLHWTEFILLRFAVDAALVLLTLILTERVWEGVWPNVYPGATFDGWLLGTWLTWLVALRLGGAYDVLSQQFAARTSVLRAVIIVSALTLALYFLAPFAFPRSLTLVALVSVGLVVGTWRSASDSWLVHWRPIQRRLLLLGLDDSTRRLAAVLSERNRTVPYVPVAFLTDDPDAPAQLLGVPVYRDTTALWTVVHAIGVHEIAVARREVLPNETQTSLIDCFHHGISAADAVALYEDLSGRLLVAQTRTDWYTELPTLPRRPYFAVKRLTDVAVAAVLLIVLSPVFALLAASVLIDDGGPILFRQIRLGRRGRPYVVHKFRTMRRDAEQSGPQYATARDPRTTRLGKFLRPAGLDELPQLWDILRGSMSLIGPRPERPEFADQLTKLLPLYRGRLLLRPGLVGWSEVHVVHASSLADHLVRLEYDLFYVKHASAFMDLNIAIRTVGLILSGRRWREPEHDADDWQGTSPAARGLLRE